MTERNPERYGVPSSSTSPAAQGIQHPEASQQQSSPEYSEVMMTQSMLPPTVLVQSAPITTMASGMQQNIFGQPSHHTFPNPTSAAVPPSALVQSAPVTTMASGMPQNILGQPPHHNFANPTSAASNPLEHLANTGPDESLQNIPRSSRICCTSSHQQSPSLGHRTYAEYGNVNKVWALLLRQHRGPAQRRLTFEEKTADTNTGIVDQPIHSNIGPISGSGSLLPNDQSNISGAGNSGPVRFAPTNRCLVPDPTIPWKAPVPRPLTAGMELSITHSPPSPQRLGASSRSAFVSAPSQHTRPRIVRNPQVDALLMEVCSRLSAYEYPTSRDAIPSVVVSREDAYSSRMSISDKSPEDSSYISSDLLSELSLPDGKFLNVVAKTPTSKVSREAITGAEYRAPPKKMRKLEHKPRRLYKEDIWTMQDDENFWNALKRFSAPNDLKCSKIVRKAETYLSNKYLEEHRDILDQVQLEGYISGQFLKSYKELHTLAGDWFVLRSAIARKSENLVVAKDGQGVKRKGRLPENIRKSPTLLSAVVGIRLPSAYSALEQVISLFKIFGEVTAVRVYKPSLADQQSHLGGYTILIPDFGSTQCCVVEFDAIEDAVTAVRMLNKDTRKPRNRDGSGTDPTTSQETKILNIMKEMPDLENARFAKLEPHMLDTLYPKDNSIGEESGSCSGDCEDKQTIETALTSESESEGPGVLEENDAFELLSHTGV